MGPGAEDRVQGTVTAEGGDSKGAQKGQPGRGSMHQRGQKRASRRKSGLVSQGLPGDQAGA